MRKRTFMYIILLVLLWLVTICFVPIAVVAALLARCTKSPSIRRLVWGSTPIINNSYWAQSMKEVSAVSETYTTGFYRANDREDWDKILEEQYGFLPLKLKPFVAFLHSLFLYDIFFISFDGYFIGRTPAGRLQAQLFKLAGKKTVLLPYGSDSYIYRRIRSVDTTHGLMMSYPRAACDQKRISQNVDYWCAQADVVLPGVMGPDGYGRWDALLPSILFIDQQKWEISTRKSNADGYNGTVYITHAPNHRGFKGSEFVVEAVNQLQQEGLDVELLLLENLKNTEVRKILREDTDVLVEQLIFTGHGLNGLEGMASGLPVIANLEHEDYVRPFRRWSYFSECPLVSATPETLANTLRKLITRPQLRHKLGDVGRQYIEKYHGLDSSVFLFTNVIDYLEGRRSDLIDLYHPLKGGYRSGEPKIDVPLKLNRIED